MYCFGGNYNTKDSCNYIPTEIVGAVVNEYNDIILEFSRPIYLYNGNINNYDLSLNVKNQYGEYELLKYRPLLYNLPANYLYFLINIDSDIKGGIYRDNLVEIRYENT